MLIGTVTMWWRTLLSPRARITENCFSFIEISFERVHIWRKYSFRPVFFAPLPSTPFRLIFFNTHYHNESAFANVEYTVSRITF